MIRRFSVEGAKSVKDDIWKGIPAVAHTETIAYIRKFVREDRRPPTDKVVEIFACQKLFGSLGIGCSTMYHLIYILWQRMCFHNRPTLQTYLCRLVLGQLCPKI
jgi:hypothetical protein